MFYVEEAPFVKSASGSVLSTPARQECEGIMEKIRAEDLTYWPYGLDIAGHTRANGNVYMIREASTKKAIGFTGWQEFKEGHRKIGYYSIGLLPEYRNQGLAKAAVAKLLRIKAASVDQVKAFIEPHNRRSIGLAKALGIPVVHG